ncbi:alpha/beta fold hydrolase [Actinoplanes sp. NPDC049668]|uniref:alpha/beta fold hydrolase n=1 Tax=unclassified Actinoplanes TaxID=2626549 RepID=UPI0033B2CB38
MVCQPHHLDLPGAGVRLHAARWPGPPGPPPLLVLHGIWESWRTFAASAERLSAGRTVYCLDLRGHGDSERPHGGYRFADYAADVRAVLPRLGTVVDVLGHSLGAAVALHAAAARPGPARIRRLVAAEPPVLLSGDWPAVRADMARFRELRRRPVDEILRELAATPARTKAWRRMIARALAETDDGVFRAMIEGEQGEVDWGALLSRVGADTLAIGADPAVPGALLTGARMRTLTAGLPSAAVAVLPAAGHHVEIDSPAAFHALVEEFLA